MTPWATYYTRLPLPTIQACIEYVDTLYALVECVDTLYALVALHASIRQAGTRPKDQAVAPTSATSRCSYYRNAATPLQCLLLIPLQSKLVYESIRDLLACHIHCFSFVAVNVLMYIDGSHM
jgi:hypothetical protein